MATLFWTLVMICAVCVVVMLVIDYLVRHDALGRTPERLLLVGTHAGVLGILSFGAAFGAGLAWMVS
jgi:hypothetical protein